MKKILSILLAAAAVLCIGGCSKSNLKIEDKQWTYKASDSEYQSFDFRYKDAMTEGRSTDGVNFYNWDVYAVLSITYSEDRTSGVIKLENASTAVESELKFSELTQSSVKFQTGYGNPCQFNESNYEFKNLQ